MIIDSRLASTLLNYNAVSTYWRLLFDGSGRIGGITPIFTVEDQLADEPDDEEIHSLPATNPCGNECEREISSENPLRYIPDRLSSLAGS